MWCLYFFFFIIFFFYNFFLFLVHIFLFLVSPTKTIDVPFLPFDIFKPHGALSLQPLQSSEGQKTEVFISYLSCSELHTLNLSKAFGSNELKWVKTCLRPPTFLYLNFFLIIVKKTTFCWLLFRQFLIYLYIHIYVCMFYPHFIWL